MPFSKRFFSFASFFWVNKTRNSKRRQWQSSCIFSVFRQEKKDQSNNTDSLLGCPKNPISLEMAIYCILRLLQLNFPETFLAPRNKRQLRRCATLYICAISNCNNETSLQALHKKNRDITAEGNFRSMSIVVFQFEMTAEKSAIRMKVKRVYSLL